MECFEPFTGIKFHREKRLLTIDVAVFCSDCDENDRFHGLEEDDISDIVVRVLLDYDAEIDKAKFIGNSLRGLFEFSLFSKILGGLACRTIRPSTIELDLDPTPQRFSYSEENPVERLREDSVERLMGIVQLNRYISTWNLCVNIDDLEWDARDIFRPFMTASHVSRLTVFSTEDESHKVNSKTRAEFSAGLTELMEKRPLIVFQHVAVKP